MTNILVEDLSAIKKKLTFEVPVERMTSLLDEEYRDLKRNVQIKGFRKGKVPLNILRSYFKTQVEADVMRKSHRRDF
jgi:trigger factor